LVDLQRKGDEETTYAWYSLLRKEGDLQTISFPDENKYKFALFG